MRKQTRWTTWLITSLAVGLAVLTICALSGPAQAAPARLPPRPTATPTPSSSPPAPAQPKSVAGALIVLEATFDETWATSGLAWQDLWTVVQWQDAGGTWYDVDGWQGALDKVAGGVGWKTWWLPADMAGEGPFRWVVYRGRGGSALVASDTFVLPSVSPYGLLIEVAITP